VSQNCVYYRKFFIILIIDKIDNIKINVRQVFLNSFLNLSISFEYKTDIKFKYKTYVLRNNCVFRKELNFLNQTINYFKNFKTQIKVFLKKLLAHQSINYSMNLMF